MTTKILSVFLSGIAITVTLTILLYFNETVWCWNAQPQCPDNTSGLGPGIHLVAVGIVFSAIAGWFVGVTDTGNKESD